MFKIQYPRDLVVVRFSVPLCTSEMDTIHCWDSGVCVCHMRTYVALTVVPSLVMVIPSEARYFLLQQWCAELLFTQLVLIKRVCSIFNCRKWPYTIHVLWLWINLWLKQSWRRDVSTGMRLYRCHYQNLSTVQITKLYKYTDYPAILYEVLGKV